MKLITVFLVMVVVIATDVDFIRTELDQILSKISCPKRESNYQDDKITLLRVNSDKKSNGNPIGDAVEYKTGIKNIKPVEIANRLHNGNHGLRNGEAPEGYYFSSPLDCRWYILCNKYGEPSIWKCPSRQIWNDTNKCCESWDHDDCPGKSRDKHKYKNGVNINVNIYMDN